MRITTSILIALTLAATFAHGKEPLWTDEERSAKSTAVFVGTIETLERAGPIDDNNDLHRAVVVVESVAKGDEYVGKAKEKISVYFERPKDGKSRRCPTYVDLKVGQRALFYLRLRKVGGEWRAFLEMGRDVREAPAAKTP